MTLDSRECLIQYGSFIKKDDECEHSEYSTVREHIAPSDSNFHVT
jgi:hypothetical protein